MEKHDLCFQRTCLRCSRPLNPTTCIALSYVTMAMQTDYMKLSMHCSWSNLKAMWSLEVCKDSLWPEIRWPLCNICISIHWPYSVILYGVPLSGWVAVIPWWHLITAAHWNSLSSWERPMLSQILVEAVCVSGLVLYTCGHGNNWNIWIQWFG